MIHRMFFHNSLEFTLSVIPVRSVKERCQLFLLFFCVYANTHVQIYVLVPVCVVVCVPAFQLPFYSTVVEVTGSKGISNVRF